MRRRALGSFRHRVVIRAWHANDFRAEIPQRRLTTVADVLVKEDDAAAAKSLCRPGHRAAMISIRGAAQHH